MSFRIYNFKLETELVANQWACSGSVYLFFFRVLARINAPIVLQNRNGGSQQLSIARSWGI